MGETILLRLDPELYEALRRWAEAELRSLNGQIEWILRDAAEKRKVGLPAKGKGRDTSRG